MWVATPCMATAAVSMQQCNCAYYKLLLCNVWCWGRGDSLSCCSVVLQSVWETEHQLQVIRYFILLFTSLNILVFRACSCALNSYVMMLASWLQCLCSSAQSCWWRFGFVETALRISTKLLYVEPGSYCDGWTSTFVSHQQPRPLESGFHAMK